MTNLSIIDIGSNTIHLLIVQVINKYTVRTLYEEKEHLRLGADLTLNNHYISNDKIKETLLILKKYIDISSTFKTSKIIAVATEALRVAKNNHYIFHLVKSQFNLSIKLLSPKEEAYLSYLGVKTIYDLTTGIIIDSGGASTEFIGIENNNYINSSSIPLGAINVTENLTTNFDGSFKCCSFTKEFFTNIFSEICWLKNYNNSTLVGIGGTFKNLKNIFIHLDNSLLKSNDLIELSSSDLYFLCVDIQRLSCRDRLNLKGLSKKRIDIILGGCEIILNFIKYLNFNKIIITDSGLRSGVLYNHLHSSFNNEISL